MYQHSSLCHVALACALVLLSVYAAHCGEVGEEEREVFIWRKAIPGSTTKWFLGDSGTGDVGQMNRLAFRKMEDPLDTDIMVRPITLTTYVDQHGAPKARLLLRQADGTGSFEIYIRTSEYPPELALISDDDGGMGTVPAETLQQFGTNEWNIDVSPQADGSESVRLYVYVGSSARPFNLAMSWPDGLTVTEATQYFSMIDADRYPYVQDWKAVANKQTIFVSNYEEGSCIETVKWTALMSSCGLSLTDVCAAPQGMTESDHTAWLRSPRSADCAELLAKLTLCCEERDPTSFADPTNEVDTTLRLIPFTNFVDALVACVEDNDGEDEEEVLTVQTAAGPLMGQTMRLSRGFSTRSLCERMMFSDSAVRPFLLPLVTCLASELEPLFPPGAYYEPEAYFEEMCVTLDSSLYTSVDPAGFAALTLAGFFATSEATTPTTGIVTNPTTGTSTSTTGSSTTGTDYVCPEGYVEAESYGANVPRCYKGFSDLSLCGFGEGAELATFRSQSEFTAVQQACQQAVAPECWIFGEHNPSYSFTDTAGWYWGNSDSNEYLTDPSNSLWSSGEPSGEEYSMYIANGQLQSKNLIANSAVVCMKAATTSSGSGGSPAPSGWVCPAAGMVMADPVGSDPARCYVRVKNVDGPDCHRDPYVTTCANLNGHLASFRSESEYNAIVSACGAPGEGYYEPGCWIDGVTSLANTVSRDKTLWQWGSSGDSNSFLIDSSVDHWSGGEPSGTWNGNPELCLQTFVNGGLNDYSCDGGLAAVCMVNGVPI